MRLTSPRRLPNIVLPVLPEPAIRTLASGVRPSISPVLKLCKSVDPALYDHCCTSGYFTTLSLAICDLLGIVYPCGSHPETEDLVAIRS